LNKQDKNIRTWKNKEGNLCFSYDMRAPMENPIIIIIILLVFIGIILFEFLFFNRYYSLTILSFSFFFILIYWAFYPLKYNEKVEEYMMNKNVNLRLHNDIKKLGEDIYEKKRKFYMETKGTYGVVTGTYMLVLLSNNDILEYELKYHTSKDNQKSTYCEFLKTPLKCLSPNRRKVIETKSFVNRLSNIKLSSRTIIFIIIFGFFLFGFSIISFIGYLYVKFGIIKSLCFFTVYIITYLILQEIINYKKNKILTIASDILSLPLSLFFLINPIVIIFFSYLLLIVYSTIPPMMIVLSLIFLFSVDLSIETSVFIILALSSIIGAYGEKFIQWMIKKSPLRNWGNHKYEEFQEELALYVTHKSNIIFFIYFVYLLYLFVSNFILIQYNRPLISVGIDNAVLKSFLVFLAFSNMINKSKEVDMKAEALLGKMLRLMKSHNSD
jgi:hypothetical protein